ncbi:MAG: DUF4321 domain-containing protein [Peptococcaceae bacterium]|nr:DUF4321 domain-containing protein [Peptococcaceae bacterium]
MAGGRNSSGAGRPIILILTGAAFGTVISFALESFGVLKIILRPFVLDIPSHTYLDFFFLSFSFGLHLNITIATIAGALGGYYLARKW